MPRRFIDPNGQDFFTKNSFRKIIFKSKGRVTEEALLDWKSCLIIGWSGMRGIVSLATAIALPMTLADGTPFPQRDTIIFIAVAVVLITIVIQGLTLPVLVKFLNVKEHPQRD